MEEFTYSRIVEETRILYVLRGNLGIYALDQLKPAIEQDIRETSLPIQLDTSALDGFSRAEERALRDWIDSLEAGSDRIVVLASSEPEDDEPGLTSLDFKDEELGAEVAGSPSGHAAPGGDDGLMPGYQAQAAGSSPGQAAPEPIAAPETGDSFLKRFCTIRYFRSMYSHRHYPLVVIFTEQELKKLTAKRVEDLTNVSSIIVDEKDPYVEIRVVFPGCMVTPQFVRSDLSRKASISRFWITPLTRTIGELKHGHVELWHQGKLVDQIATPATIVGQTKAVFSFAFAFLMPVLSLLVKLYSEEIKTILPVAAHTIFEGARLFLGNPVWIGALVSVLFLASALLYVRNSPREAKPVQSALSV